jgi:LmbE family N-acetylglucosaminyl deacetylase
MKDKILVVVAHPDDEILGVGGTMILHVDSGDEMRVMLLTSGGLGSSSAEELRDQSEECARFIGVSKVYYCGFPDQHLEIQPLIEIIQAIERVIAEYEPDVVYTHYHGDLNIDHRITSNAVLTAVRPNKKKNVQRIYTFPVNSSSEWTSPFPETTFIPNVYVDISTCLEKKIKAFEIYRREKREFPHPRSIEGIRVTAAREGMNAGMKAAETFALIRELKYYNQNRLP